ISSTLLLSIMSLGKNFEFFNRLLFDNLPYLNKFRAPSSMLTIIALLVGTMAFYTLSKMIKSAYDQDKIKRALMISFGILASICVFFWIIGPGFFDMSKGENNEQTKVLVEIREAMMTGDALRGLIILLIGSGLIYFFNAKKIGSNIFLAAFGVVMLFDIYTINNRYLSHSDFMTNKASQSIFKPRNVDNQILLDNSLGYRVFDLTIDTYNSSIPSYYHRTIGGYHPAKLRRYQDLIDHCIDSEKTMLGGLLKTYTGNPDDSNFVRGMSQLHVLNMLNTKYFILGEQGKELAFPNNNAYGTSWFVKDVKWVNSADEEIDALKSTDLKTTVVIHNEWKQSAGVQGDGLGSIKLVEYMPNSLKYNSESATEQIAVLSEIWYGPNLGWTASIDGKSTDLFRVNYALRGVRVPAGKHEILLNFKPTSYFLGKTLASIFSILLIGIMGVCVWMYSKKDKPIE
ncbi:MAG: YfhO family protein, partial [Saprospiraceae bacterium]